jgi:hypothetical protein
MDVMVQERVHAAITTILVFGEGSSADGSLDGFRPPDPENFGCTVQALIGDASDGRSDSFDIVVCSPSWFAEQVAAGSWDRFRNGGLRVIPDSVVVGSGMWFMRRWDQPEFESAVHAIVESASPGPDWGSVANRIGRLIPWEFDYRYDEHVDEDGGETFPPMA